MTLFQYVDAHPFLTFLWLLLVGTLIESLFYAWAAAWAKRGGK